MRRKDRECNESSFIDEVCDRAETMFLALMDGDYPYCLPVNFARAGNTIYIHSALTGHKLDCIRQKPHVSFSLAVDVEIVRHEATTCYKSVCGRGKASIVEDEKEKGAALDALASRYKAEKCQIPAPVKNINRVAIIRIDIEQITGKRCLSAK